MTAPEDYGSDFPATLITTELGWDDLSVTPNARDELRQIVSRLEHARKAPHHQRPFRASERDSHYLFSGPSGTGKTMAAALIGAAVGVDVYRVDLSTVVSKYIGETEKNLARVFDRAEAADWILFFDEADALFGKRTEVQDSHDRYANPEISYLLERMDTYPGVVILATNLKSNIDPAFLRRFHSIIDFSDAVC